ncbi:hypothetical protein FRC20_005727, partial [Serendipita sp. 405]
VNPSHYRTYRPHSLNGQPSTDPATGSSPCASSISTGKLQSGSELPFAPSSRAPGGPRTRHQAKRSRRSRFSSKTGDVYSAITSISPTTQP